MSKSILVIDTPERCSMCKLLERTEAGAIGAWNKRI